MLRPARLPDDRDGIHRVWREVGWIGTGERDRDALDAVLAETAALVVDVDGQVEGHGGAHHGTIRHGDVDLPALMVGAIVVGRRARKRGFARALTSRLVADGAAEGAAVACLGVFDQGFYEGVGFGMGPAMTKTRFDAASLAVPVPSRMPVRLTIEDGARMMANRQARARGHGNATFTQLSVLL